MSRPRLMAGVFHAASGRASSTPDRDATERERDRHDLGAFLDATGGDEGPWCVRYDATEGPVREAVRPFVEGGEP